MDEKNRVNTDLTDLLASELEYQGMSRRQRRELAQKQAAEEAAKLESGADATGENADTDKNGDNCDNGDNGGNGDAESNTEADPAVEPINLFGNTDFNNQDQNK